MKRPRILLGRKLLGIRLGILSVIMYTFIVPDTANAQWVQTSGPGGTVLSLAANGGNLFAGTSGGGVFLTTNNGTSWTAVNTGLTNPIVLSLAASGGNVFAGTQGGGVFLTTNNGTSWSAVNSGLSNLTVYALMANGGYIFAGTMGGGVFLTTNNGTNWTPVNTGLTNLNVLAIIANGGYVFAGTNGSGVFLTTNNGTSWTRVSSGLTSAAIVSLAVNGGNVFAGTGGSGVFLSTNNGTNWTAVNTGLTNLIVLSLAASGGNVFAGTQGGGVFLTPNNGTNWVDFNAGLTSLNVLALAASGSNLFAGVAAAPGVRRRPLSDVGNLPAAPTLSSPVNGATGEALSPTMTWNTVTGATSYRLQVSTISTFTSAVFNDSTLTGTSKAIGPLVAATVYYWRVRAKNTIGTGWWSTVWSFTTIWSPPAAPVLSSPVDGATIRVPNLTTSWNASSGAASYTLNVSTASDFSTLAVNQPNIVATSQWVKGLSNNTTYYWRVNAVNPAGASPWSDTLSFTMALDTTYGCIAHWSFDSTSGNTFYDVTGHGYDASATGTGVGLASGIKGQALSCPGSNFEVTVANSSNNFSLTKLTIEGWIQCNIIPPTISTIFDHTFVPATGWTCNGYNAAVQGGRVVFFLSSSDGGNWAVASSSIILSSGTWYHFACTYDSAVMIVYVNGVLSGSLSYQGTFPPPGADAHIGCQRRQDGNVYYPFNGLIDELKLYNYALPADSITTHYLATAIKSTQKNPLLASSLKVQARNSLLTISLPSAMTGKAVDVAVYSASGRVLVKKSMRSAAARFTLPVPNLAFGAYVLSVNDGNRKSTMRFVVLR